MQLSIVIVTFKSDESLLAECVRSVAAACERAAIPHEVIIVDNNSGSSYLHHVRESFSAAAKIVPLDENLGFGAACNVGIRLASMPYILLLNPDASLEAGSLTELSAAWEALDGAPTLMAGLLLRGGGLQVDAYWSWSTSVEHFVRRPAVKRSLDSSISSTAIIDVQKVCGGALVARRDLLIDLGPFDERFFLYGEDADLSARALRRGCRLVLMRDLRVAHVGAASMTSHSSLVERCRVDAALRLAAHHRGAISQILVRMDLWGATLLGLVGGARSSSSRRTRFARVRELRRWGFSREAPRLSAALLS